MKTVSFAFALLTLISVVYSQDTSKIPTLPIWYEASGISKVSFLENFDVANGGNNAIAINKNCGETWYLGNGKVDTNNKFCWGRGGGFRIDKVDFNGDGIADYFHDNGDVFLGTQKDSPPQSKPIAHYTFPYGSNRRTISDFNNDGKEDVFDKDYDSPYLVKILLGNDNLNNMKIINMPYIQNTAYSLQYVVGAWKDTDGKNKIVLYQQTDTNYAIRTEAYFLYEFKINNDLTVEYTALDTTDFKDFKDKFTSYYYYESSFIWRSKNRLSTSLIASSKGITNIYGINSKNYTIRKSIISKNVCMGILENGKKESSENGYIMGYIPFSFLYEGNPVEENTPFAWLPINYDYIRSIGDVNADGMTDFVTTDESNGIARFYFGFDRDVGVINDFDNNFSFKVINNQPFHLNELLLLEISNQQLSHITINMYDVTGKSLTKLWDGAPSEIQSRIPINMSGITLSDGIYTIRMTDGKIICDRVLLIIK